MRSISHLGGVAIGASLIGSMPKGGGLVPSTSSGSAAAGVSSEATYSWRNHVNSIDGLIICLSASDVLTTGSFYDRQACLMPKK
jgi:hypothetical protein